MTPARKKINAKQNKPILERVCKELGVSVRYLQPMQCRLTKDNYQTYDYYPTSGRAAVIGLNEWLTITDIEQFLREKFTGEMIPANTLKVGDIINIKVSQQKRCTDCMFITPQEELNKFGGKCKECFEDKE